MISTVGGVFVFLFPTGSGDAVVGLVVILVVGVAVVGGGDGGISGCGGGCWVGYLASGLWLVGNWFFFSEAVAGGVGLLGWEERELSLLVGLLQRRERRRWRKREKYKERMKT